MFKNCIFITVNFFYSNFSMRGASDSVTIFSVLSNPVGAQNVIVWDFMIEIIVRKAMLNMSWVISILRIYVIFEYIVKYITIFIIYKKY